MIPDDLFNSRRFRAVYGQGVFGQNVQPAPTTPARQPGATNTQQTWTEAQVLRLARLRVAEEPGDLGHIGPRESAIARDLASPWQ